MKFSFSGVWDDTARMLRANGALFIAIAGVFLFLPSIIIGYVAPQPSSQAATWAAVVASITAYMREHWLLILVVNVIGFIGNLAILLLALDPERPTVGRAIIAACRLLPVYFAVSVLFALIASLGFMAFIIPAFYLIARMSLMGPVVVAENLRNPFAVLRRSFAITKRNGWAVFGLIAGVFITFWIASLAATVVFGSIFLLIDRVVGAEGVGTLMILLMGAAISAAFNTVLMVLLASLYRRLAPAQSSGI